MNRLLRLLPMIAIVTVIFATMYSVSQQMLRLGANDPQIQLATDIANNINSGGSAQISNGDQVDLKHSLAPFTNVYDKNGQPLSGTGYLNGSFAKPPLGIMTAAKGQEYNAVTWQPEKGVRLATVAVDAGHGEYFVVSGRSLREVERREQLVLVFCTVGWVLAMLVLVAVQIARRFLNRFSVPLMPVPKKRKV
jgi:hypothetical protein